MNTRLGFGFPVTNPKKTLVLLDVRVFVLDRNTFKDEKKRFGEFTLNN